MKAQPEAEKPQKKLLGVKRALNFGGSSNENEPSQKKLCVDKYSTPVKKCEEESSKLSQYDASERNTNSSQNQLPTDSHS